jgi:hypothetical protein
MSAHAKSELRIVGFTVAILIALYGGYCVGLRDGNSQGFDRGYKQGANDAINVITQQLKGAEPHLRRKEGK